MHTRPTANRETRPEARAGNAVSATKIAGFIQAILAVLAYV
jgi:hypothetical protein